MKTMTCEQLGGACDMEFRGNTFEEIMAQSKAHGREMFKQKDNAHLKAMQDMQALMQSPEVMQEWLEAKRRQFENLPD
ncbi:MAG: DUF1059 domain-containing protein [Eudoraea sp.]|nr:DUF1059 domain-containing protein [Eudoraea sp.]